ncbi:hypothetical protein NQ318_001086 [Aromia moschata]|uniref:PINIT domain-containing protein n=1 Tax=Aromia moschata TaxID=1265417 RepID=A0AAV8ZDX4_9CUCU|nr:hypothetical protein NQ318_001086 [Aromia moschata]
MSENTDELREETSQEEKNELQQRALELLRVRSHPIHQKIRDLYKTIQAEPLTGVPPQSSSPGSNKDLSASGQVNSMPQTQGGVPRTTAAVHPYNVDTRQMATHQPQMYQQNIYSPYPQYSTAKQQQTVLANNYPIHPDVKFRRLPFYDILADLLKPSSLVPQSNQRMHEGTFYFHLTPQQATDVASSRDIRPGVKCDYVKQVQMRFCLLETTCEQEDYFPPTL